MGTYNRWVKNSFKILNRFGKKCHKTSVGWAIFLTHTVYMPHLYRIIIELCIFMNLLYKIIYFVIIYFIIIYVIL